MQQIDAGTAGTAAVAATDHLLGHRLGNRQANRHGRFFGNPMRNADREGPGLLVGHRVSDRDAIRVFGTHAAALTIRVCDDGTHSAT